MLFDQFQAKNLVTIYIKLCYQLLLSDEIKFNSRNCPIILPDGFLFTNTRFIVKRFYDFAEEFLPLRLN